MSNIYLDRLDRFVDTALIPEYTRGKGRAENPAYKQVSDKIVRACRRYDLDEVRRLRQQPRTLTRGAPHDPGFRRLRYARYADDHLLGFIGPKAEAEAIKARLAQFLREDLKLDLSPDKTLITHGRTAAARFLGYEIIVQHADHKATNGRRSVNGKVALRVSRDVIKAKAAPYLKFGKPERRPDLSCLPRRADATAVIGAALLARAAGRRHRAIAADLRRPVSTVRRWLRRVRGRHVDWLRRRGIAAAHRVDPDTLGGLAEQPTPLGDAVHALAGAVHAYRHRFEHHTEPWPLINILLGGRLLTPVPAD